MFERGLDYSSLAKQEASSAMLAHTFAVGFAVGGFGEVALYAREALQVVFRALALRQAGGLGWYGVDRVEPSQWRRLVQEARPLWLDFMLESAFDRVQVLAAAGVAGEGGAGVFTQAKRLSMVPHQFLQPLTGRLAFNWYSREGDRAARRALGLRLQALVLGPLLLSVAAVWRFADEVIPFVFGAKWAPVAPVLVALSGNILFPSLFVSNKMLLMANNTMRPVLIARVVQIVPVVLPCLLQPWLGGSIIRVVIGVSVGWAGAFLLTILLLQRMHRTGSRG